MRSGRPRSIDAGPDADSTAPAQPELRRRKPAKRVRTLTLSGAGGKADAFRVHLRDGGLPFAANVRRTRRAGGVTLLAV